jgi:hypothetical protein
LPATVESTQSHEVTCEVTYLINGKVVKRVLHFVVSEQKFQEQYNNTAPLGTP